MRFYVVTLFPELVERFAATALIGRAVDAGRLDVATVDPRAFTTDRHRTVDDAPYGGGSGMVMKAAPLLAAIEHADVDAAARDLGAPLRVLLTPQGEPLGQARVAALARRRALTLVCGRYEGVDERARAAVDLELSLGDFVLMGGEVAAMAVIEAVARLVPGVLGNPASAATESHAGGLLEHPHYTRPAVLRGEAVPAVLLSGDHARVARWRLRQAVARTRARRPDLLARLEPGAEALAILEELEAEG